MYRVIRPLCAPIFLFLLTIGVAPFLMLGAPAALAQAAKSDQESAFDAAKELGTIDAWNAFLKSYPTGFHADLARAYVKNINTQQAGANTPATPEVTTSSSRVGERPCSELKTLRSEKNTEPTAISFVNNSGMYRSISWITYDGKLQDFGGLNPGEHKTIETFRTHPWMIATGPGDCLQIFLPAAEPATVSLLRLAADNPPPSRPPVTKSAPPPKKPPPVTRRITCAENYKLVNGGCVLVQNCGAIPYRSAEGDCYCKKGYNRVNGRCVWPISKKSGFEIAPWKKPGCSTWQAQCKQGNTKSCVKFEETCQVN